MVLIFVARDPDEFKKYEAAIGSTIASSTRPVSVLMHGEDAVGENQALSESELSEENPAEERNCLNEVRDDEVALDENRTLSDDEWNEDSPKEKQNRLNDLWNYTIRFFHKTLKAEDTVDHVFLLNGIPNKDEAKCKVKFPQDLVNVYTDIFAGLVKYAVGDNVTDKDIFVFIHWGIESPSECEKEFRKKTKQTSHPNINTFAVSTLRPECFDVTGDKILLPDNHHEVCDVILRFTYGLLKNTLSEYVWSGRLELSEYEFSQLNFYLHDWLPSRIKEVITKEDLWKMAGIKAWETIKSKCVTRDNNSVIHCVIEKNKQLTALFSELIANGGCI